LFQPDGGVVAADRAVRAFVASATDHGADLLEGWAVERLEPEGAGVTVMLGQERIRAGVAVVTAGAWARSLLERAGIERPTRATRETVAYFRLPAGVEESIPTVVDWGRPAVYALPSPAQGVKAGEHQAGPTIDPDVDGPPDDGSVARLSAWVADRYPGVDRKAHLVETCLYTNTEDDHFVLERHGPIVVGSPCSGHGFKFAPLIGERLAALAAD
jgi:sarcosine oxidase